jgi:hypothetical protein
VTTFFPIAKAAITESIKAGILNGTFRLNDAFFEPGDRHDDFESRARWILTLNRAVIERPKLVFNESVPFFGFDTAGKSIRIKRRSAGQRKYGAVVNIQRNDGARFTVERFVSGELQLAVLGQVDRVAGHVGDLVQHSHAPAEGIDLDLLSAALAAQQFFPAPLESVLANFIADDVSLLF